MRIYSNIIIFIFSFFCYSQINYVDQASILGINKNTGSVFFGGKGASFVDYNNDGFDDITLATNYNQSVIFYKNLDGIFFIEESLLPNSLQPLYEMRSVIWVDYDNDNDKDLFITSSADGNRLFKNNNGILVDVTSLSGLPIDNLNTFGASFGDYNNDGCLDIYVSNRIGGTLITNYLFKNNCNGTFTDVTVQSGLDDTTYLSHCSAFFDYNNDGYQDLYIANDKNAPNFMYKNNGDGTFTDVSIASGTNIIVDAMSVTIDDYNSDGYFDIFITNTPEVISTNYAPGTVLLKNNGDETFTDITDTANVSLDSYTWGSNFLDAENDGDLDLYINSQYTSLDNYPSYGFYENNNGMFSVPSSLGFLTNDYKSYASAIGDFNNDGATDIISNNDDDQIPSLWVNNSTITNNYLAVKLEGINSNKDGIGSKIEISVNGNKQYRYILCGEGYLSQNSFKEIFGIGSSTSVDYIKIDWLSGITDIFYNISANQILNIVEGSSSTLEISNDNKDNIKIFPNPSKNIVSISNNHNINSILLINSLGQKVFRKVVNTSIVNLDVSDFSAGVYTIQIHTDYGIKTKKIIKQ